ncbi:MAG: Sec-independent protein translocase protein TatB [Methylohalobius sp.]
MFDVGFWELVLVGVVSLLVLGPERLPGAVRMTVRLLRRARSVVATAKAEIERELALDEIKASLEQGTSFKELKALEKELRQPVTPAPTIAEKDPLKLKTAAADDDST